MVCTGMYDTTVTIITVHIMFSPYLYAHYVTYYDVRGLRGILINLKRIDVSNTTYIEFT